MGDTQTELQSAPWTELLGAARAALAAGITNTTVLLRLRRAVAAAEAQSATMEATHGA